EHLLERRGMRGVKAGDCLPDGLRDRVATSLAHDTEQRADDVTLRAGEMLDGRLAAVSGGQGIEVVNWQGVGGASRGGRLERIPYMSDEIHEVVTVYGRIIEAIRGAVPVRIKPATATGHHRAASAGCGQAS